MLLAVALGTILAPVNSTMIAVALPQIMVEFDADVASAGWLVTAYLITLAALQPVSGKLGDRWGRRRLMLWGLAGFGLASLGAALAPSLPVLIAFRTLQAVAGAVTLPNGAALVREVVPAARRAHGFGLIGAAAGLAAAVGPTLGGLVIGAGDWRAIFYVNVPIVLAALALSERAIPRRATQKRDQSFDLLGAVLVCGVLVGAAGLLVEGRGSASAPVLALSGLALGAATAFLLRHELRHDDPVIHPRLFRIRSFAAANAGVGFGNLAFYTTLLAAPILLASRIGWSSVQVGLALTVLSAPWAVLAPVGGRIADRSGRRVPAVAGHVLAAAGLLPLALVADVGTGTLLACLGVAGVGFGLTTASLQTSAIEAVSPEQAGVAAGLFSTSRYLGSIAGSIVLAALLTSTGAGVSGFRALAVVIVAAAFLAALVSLGLRGRPAPSPAVTVVPAAR